MPLPLVGQQALFNWCQHNWFEILFLTEMDSLGWARAVFILDGQEIKCIPETATRFIFQVFLLKIGLIRLWLGNFLLALETFNFMAR